MPGTVIHLSVPTNLRLTLGRLFSIALLLMLGSNLLQAGQAKPRKHEARHEIDRMEEAWRNAVLKSDTNTMSSLLADDYMAITSSGTLQTKDEALTNMRTRKMHFTEITVSDRKVRFYGKTALVTSKAEVQGAMPEGEVTGDFRYTRVYVRDAQGKWKIVSFEASRIRPPGEHRRQDARTSPQ